MIAALLVGCFLSCWFFYKYYRCIYNPVSLFTGIWFVVFFLYALNPYGLPIIKSSTILIFVTGLLSFVLGSTLCKVRPQKEQIHLVVPKVNYKLINSFIVLLFLLTIMPAYKALRLILGGVDLHDIRYVYRSEIIGDGLVDILYVYFCDPFTIFLMIFSLYNLFCGKDKKFYMIITIISLILNIITRGGRFNVLYFIVALGILILLFRKGSTVKPIINLSKFLIIIGISILFLVSIIRGSDVMQTVFVYPSGAIPFMEHRINETAVYPHTLGIATLNGFIRPIYVIMRKFIGGEFIAGMTLVEMIDLEDGEGVTLAYGVVYNSFVSIFYSMYRDGGLFGVLFFSFLLGYISMKMYKNIYSGQPRDVMLYMLVGMILLLSFFRFLIVSYQFALSFFYVYLLVKPKKKLPRINQIHFSR